MDKPILIYPEFWVLRLGKEFEGCNGLVKTTRHAIGFPSWECANMYVEQAYNDPYVFEILKANKKGQIKV